MKNLKNLYLKYFHISQADLIDSSESNRLNALVVSSLLLLSDLIDATGLLIIYHAHLKEQLHYIIYLCIYTPINLAIFLWSKHSKNGSYVRKMIPVYLLLFVGLSASVFNFYFMERPLNGIITYYLAGFLFILVFSTSPFVVLSEFFITVCILAPGVYKSLGILSAIDICVGMFIMFFAALYKRHLEKKHLMLLKKQRFFLEAKTFGNFTLIHEGKVVKFSRTKSEELIAYLIYKNGSSSNSKELRTVLWGEGADSARYGSSLRNLIIDVKHTLEELGIQNFFITEYNSFRINPEVVKCDYYDFLAGDRQAVRSFAGEFMSQFGWAAETVSFLEKKVLNR